MLGENKSRCSSIMPVSKWIDSSKSSKGQYRSVHRDIRSYYPRAIQGEYTQQDILEEKEPMPECKMTMLDNGSYHRIAVACIPLLWILSKQSKSDYKHLEKIVRTQKIENTQRSKHASNTWAECMCLRVDRELNFLMIFSHVGDRMISIQEASQDHENSPNTTNEPLFRKISDS